MICDVCVFPQAMDLEVPVLARDIPGNAAVVQHEMTGLLYSSPQVHDDKVIKSPNVFSSAFCTDVLLKGMFSLRTLSRCCHPWRGQEGRAARLQYKGWRGAGAGLFDF